MARLIFGMQPVREAIRARGKDLEVVFVQAGAGPKHDAVARFAADQGVRVERVSRADLDSRTRNGFHQGVVALAPAGPVAIVIGAEDRGPRRPVLAACAHVARLPLPGPVAALNASVAAAIALYEVQRQRRARGGTTASADERSSPAPAEDVD